MYTVRPASVCHNCGIRFLTDNVVYDMVPSRKSPSYVILRVHGRMADAPRPKAAILNTVSLAELLRTTVYTEPCFPTNVCIFEPASLN
jgi:hypothetical protein